MSAVTFTAGRPGGHAARLARRFQLRALAAVVLTAAAGWYCLTHLDDLAAGGPRAVLAGAAAAVAIAGAVAAQALRERAGRAMVGARSERRVAKVAARLAPTGLLHSVDLDAGGDADHLLCGPKLVVVETKTGSGVVSYKDGKLYVNNRPMRGDPVAQCRRQATAARGRFGVFCDAVVCVVDMVNAPFTVSSVLVCSLADLPSVYTGLPDRVSPDQAWARAVELADACSTVHAKRASVPKQAATGTRGNAPAEAAPSPRARQDRRRSTQGPDRSRQGGTVAPPPSTAKLRPRGGAPPPDRR